MVLTRTGKVAWLPCDERCGNVTSYFNDPHTQITKDVKRISSLSVL